MRKFLLVLTIITICIFNLFSIINFAALKIDNVVDEVYVDSNPKKTNTLEIIASIDEDLTIDAESHPGAIQRYVLTDSKKNSSWFADSSGARYFVVEFSDKGTSKSDYSQGSLSHKKAYAAAILANCTALIGTDKNGYKIYQFDANGRASDDGSAAVIYDSNGQPLSSVQGVSYQVYSNPTGWKKDTSTNRWYYYTDGSHVLYDGCAIIINTSDTNYKLYKFNTNCTCSADGISGIKDGSADEVKLQAANKGTSNPAAQVLSINDTIIKKKGILTNTNYNKDGEIKQGGIVENEGNTTGSNSALLQILDATCYEGDSYTTSNKRGWKKMSNGKYRYYTDEYVYLIDGYAIIATDSSNVNYALYPFDKNGYCGDAVVTNTIEGLRKTSNTGSYKLVTTKTDTELQKKDELGNTADNLDVYAVYDGWVKKGDKYIYEPGGSGTLLKNGYAICPATRTTWAIYHFDKDGYMDGEGTAYDTQDEVRENADTNINYNAATIYDPNDLVGGDVNVGGNGVSADQLVVYEDENGWEQSKSKYRYFTDSYTVLSSGCAIVQWGGQYCIYKFNSSGYYDSQVGQPASSVEDLISNSKGSYIEAVEVDLPENVDGEDKEKDEDEEKDDGIEIYDDGMTYKESKVISYGGQKFYSDAEFLAAISILPNNIVPVLDPNTKFYFTKDVKDGWDETPEQKEDEDRKETLVKNMSEYKDYSLWGNDKRYYTDKDHTEYLADGFALVIWQSTPNRYALVEFDANGYYKDPPADKIMNSFKDLKDINSDKNTLEEEYIEARKVKVKK